MNRVIYKDKKGTASIVQGTDADGKEVVRFLMLNSSVEEWLMFPLDKRPTDDEALAKWSMRPCDIEQAEHMKAVRAGE